MNGPFTAALAAEAVVLLVIFIGVATYVNSGAIFSAINLWMSP